MNPEGRATCNRRSLDSERDARNGLPMIPEALIPSLVALGCGLAGAVVGLFVGFAPEPHLAALRRARRATSTTLREGELVMLEGSLFTPEPLDGAISRGEVAAQYLEHRFRLQRDKDRHLRGALGTAPHLALRDRESQVAIELEGGSLVTVKSFHGTEDTVGERWGQLAVPGAIELVEHSIPLGAQVVLVGEAAQVDGKWVVRGRDAFLSDAPLAELRRKDSFNRGVGLTLIIASLVGGVVIAVQLAG